MTDIRTAAQSVIALYDYNGALYESNHADAKSIEALRQALATPVEPVAWINVENRKLEWNTDFPVRWETPTVVKLDKLPLYTTPPSVDALIAEIMDVQVWCEGNDEFLSCSYDDVVRILNRYRGQK